MSHQCSCTEPCGMDGVCVYQRKPQKISKRIRLINSLIRFHLAKVNETTDYYKTEKVSRVLTGLTKKIRK